MNMFEEAENDIKIRENIKFCCHTGCENDEEFLKSIEFHKILCDSKRIAETFKQLKEIGII